MTEYVRVCDTTCAITARVHLFVSMVDEVYASLLLVDNSDDASVHYFSQARVPIARCKNTFDCSVSPHRAPQTPSTSVVGAFYASVKVSYAV